jgi:hypothetical protein
MHDNLPLGTPVRLLPGFTVPVSWEGQEGKIVAVYDFPATDLYYGARFPGIAGGHTLDVYPDEIEPLTATLAA